MSTEAEADWVERESLPENRVTANLTGHYRHPLVLATAERLKKEKVEDGLSHRTDGQWQATDGRERSGRCRI